MKKQYINPSTTVITLNANQTILSGSIIGTIDYTDSFNDENSVGSRRHHYDDDWDDEDF